MSVRSTATAESFGTHFLSGSVNVLLDGISDRTPGSSNYSKAKLLGSHEGSPAHPQCYEDTNTIPDEEIHWVRTAGVAVVVECFNFYYLAILNRGYNECSAMSEVAADWTVKSVVRFCCYCYSFRCQSITLFLSRFPSQPAQSR